MTCRAPALAANLFILDEMASSTADIRVDIHAENARAATNVENDLILEEMLILVDGISIGSGPDLIFLEYRSLFNKIQARFLQPHTSISSWIPFSVLIFSTHSDYDRAVPVTYHDGHNYATWSAAIIPFHRSIH